jgi:hypothetical protein
VIFSEEPGVDLAWIFLVASVLALLGCFLHREWDAVWAPLIWLSLSSARLWLHFRDSKRG